jgi:hypothetical protein
MVRPATIHDCPAMMQLIQELALYEKAPEQVTVTMDTFIASGFGESPCYWAFVAEEENKIIGFALCYTRYSTWKGPRCYLEDLIVTESFSAVVWQVLDWNTPAIEFYKRYKANFDAEWINCSVELG